MLSVLETPVSLLAVSTGVERGLCHRPGRQTARHPVERGTQAVHPDIPRRLDVAIRLAVQVAGPASSDLPRGVSRAGRAVGVQHLQSDRLAHLEAAAADD